MCSTCGCSAEHDEPESEGEGEAAYPPLLRLKARNSSVFGLTYKTYCRSIVPSILSMKALRPRSQRRILLWLLLSRLSILLSRRASQCGRILSLSEGTRLVQSLCK